MYHKAYGIIETLAPLHVGASAGEETGNLNLIFRDQFTQTGVIPGSSIRGRFRADMRQGERPGLSEPQKRMLTNIWYGHDSEADPVSESEVSEVTESVKAIEATKDRTTEALVKFEYASIVWLPVFCPGQPIVWVTCPRFLKRYQQITGLPTNNEGRLASVPKPVNGKNPVSLRGSHDRLFFNLGFLDNLEVKESLPNWVPDNTKVQPDNLVVVDDADISLIHEMALYRQTRTKLQDEVKKVENFFGFEALPEDSILVFPVAIKKAIPTSAIQKLQNLKQKETWQPFSDSQTQARQNRELYFGGLESIGCGRCRVSLSGQYISEIWKQEDK
jgi:CRISPR-associated protein Cmr4